jgi:tetratricopeptide (TPR) repeat protein
MRRRSEIIPIAPLFLTLCIGVLCAGQSQTGVTASVVQSIEAARSAIIADPGSQTARLSLAELYLRAGRNQDAIETLKDLLQRHPESGDTLRLLALAYARKEDYPSAKEAAEQALRFSPNHAPTIEVLALAHAGLQDEAGAERLFREALKLDPNSIEANYQLGLLFVRAHKNLPDAIRFLEKARTTKPDLTGIDLALGSAYLENGKPLQAITFLQSATRSDTDPAEAYYLLASAFRQQSQPDQATRALASFNTAKKSSAARRAREMQAQADYQQGVNLLANSDNLDGAYLALSKAAAQLLDFDPAYYRMAQVAYLKHDLAGAESSIRHALTLNPFEPEYYFVLARCLEESDPSAALVAIESAVKLKPGVADFEELQRTLRDLKPASR